MRQLVISVVMPTLNQGQYIEQSIRSVIDQGYSRLDFIVVDGGSTDQTKAILQRYEQQSGGRFRWISEPDNGLYEALNKAIRMARGEFIGWLNSDDLYAPGTLEAVAAGSVKYPNVDIFCGDAELFENLDGMTKVLKRYHHYHGETFAPTPENLQHAHLNACFIRKGIYNQFGLYDTRFRIAADRDFMMMLMRANLKSHHVGKVMCRYRSHERALTHAGFDQSSSQFVREPTHPALRELIEICARHLSDRQTPVQVRSWCRRLHTGLTLAAYSYSLRQKQFGKAFVYLKSGTSYDLWWPLRALMVAVSHQ